MTGGMNPPNFKVANESASDPVLNRMVGTLMEAVLKSWHSFSMKVCSPSESAMVFISTLAMLIVKRLNTMDTSLTISENGTSDNYPLIQCTLDIATGLRHGG